MWSCGWLPVASFPATLRRRCFSGVLSIWPGWHYAPRSDVRVSEFANGLRNVVASSLCSPRGSSAHLYPRSRRLQAIRRVLRSALHPEAVHQVPAEPQVQGSADVGEHRSEEHTSELQSHVNLVCRLLLEKKKKKKKTNRQYKKKKKNKRKKNIHK